jgi:hypothetical protein
MVLRSSKDHAKIEWPTGHYSPEGQDRNGGFLGTKNISCYSFTNTVNIANVLAAFNILLDTQEKLFHQRWQIYIAVSDCERRTIINVDVDRHLFYNANLSRKI